MKKENLSLSALKIRTKILLIAMLSTFFGMISLTIAYIYFDVSLLETRRNERVQTQMEILASNLAATILFDDTESAQEILSALAVDPTVTSATAKKTDSSTFSAFNAKNNSKDSNAFNPIAYLTKLSNEQTFYKEIKLEGETIGNLELVISNRILDAHIAELSRYAIQTLIVITILVFGVSLWLQLSISRPILLLSRLSKRVTLEGNYTLRATPLGQDEVADLARDFNTMLDQIEQRDSMLERKVMHRTSELEKLAEEFRHRAFHDSLTGLPNRALLNERFSNALAHAKRARNKFALLLLDLDNFKNINDSLGHDIGDELLKTVAERIKKSVREEDLVCRLGGDEFIVMLEDIKEINDVRIVSTNITKSLQKQAIILGRRLEITTSIGGCIYPDHGIDLTTLKRGADIAMYNAKDAGKNRFALFETAMEETTLHKLMVQNELREAISHQQMKLYYQPKIDGRHNRVAGCEVLVRWHHPKEGIIYPDNFIPYAEEAGLIRLIDYYVLDSACAQAKKWSQELDEPLGVAINLSGTHFHDENIVGVIKIALLTNDLRPELLEIELTEGVLISDPEMALRVLTAIKELGVTISLDDFGVGYSSLYYLRKLPIDIIKLDKSFIASIMSNAQDRRLTKGIISLADGLELGVIAEGVEDKQQAEFLLSNGCHLLQGYYFQRPQPLKIFESWLAEYKRQPLRLSAAK